MTSRVLGPDGDERLAGADGEGRDGRALDDGARVAGHERPVGVRGRVRAVAVGDDVAPRGSVPAAVRHLSPAGIAGTAPAAQAGCADRRDRRRRAQVADRPAQPVEGAGGDGRIEVGRVGGVGPREQDARPAVRRRSSSTMVRPGAGASGAPASRRARRRGPRDRSPRPAGAAATAAAWLGRGRRLEAQVARSSWRCRRSSRTRRRSRG